MVNFYSYIGWQPAHTRVDLNDFLATVHSGKNKADSNRNSSQTIKSSVDICSWFSLGNVMSLPSLKLAIQGSHYLQKKFPNSNMISNHDSASLVAYLVAYASMINHLEFLQTCLAAYFDTCDLWCNAQALVLNRPKFQAWILHWRRLSPWTTFFNSSSLFDPH